MSYNFQIIDAVEGLKGRRVIVRLDLNLPFRDGVITDDFRFTQTLPTLLHLKERGARVLLLAHIEGREAHSLRPVFEHIKKNIPVTFVETIAELPARMEAVQEGEFLLLENLRISAEEEENSEAFARTLASFGDIFVNEAFSVSHRSHASIVGIPRYLPSYAGFLFAKEVRELSVAFAPKHPFLFILGGAKFETKLPLVTKFVSLADTLYISGALANDFFHARGLEVGKSLLSSRPPALDTLLSNARIHVPVDAVVEEGGISSIRDIEAVSKEAWIRDAGPRSLEELRSLISNAAFILWNGPLGLYEEGFSKGTETLAAMIASSSAQSIVGGGDTLAALSHLEDKGKFSFISTGGGAMLAFLATETLPGIEALEASTLSRVPAQAVLHS